ncbi:MAG: eL32 family ribosomal protein [Candidatus Micrarchaeia archaeon]
MGKHFIRINSSKYVRVKQTWRKPHGIDNKQRARLRSRPAVPRIGYGKPAADKNKHPTGVREALVANARDLEAAPAGVAIRFIGTLGKAKRAVLAAKAREKGFHVLNG